MLLKNISALIGENLDFVSNIDIQIKDEKFQKIHSNIKSNSKKDIINCEGLLLIPGFINSHTHIADSIGKDITLNSTVNQKIHPMFGIKSKILKNTSNQNLSTFMKNTCHSMIQKGITTFVDFREGGLDGALLLKKVSDDTSIRSIILGRLDFHQNTSEIKKNDPFPKEKLLELPSLVKTCDGIGISGANEHSTSVLTSYSKTKKLRAIHSSETQESVQKSKRVTGKSETIRALSLNPDFLIHMTHASKSDLEATSKKTRGIVICPRANSSLSEGIPDIEKMQNAGCLLALGTDNVMINSPDIFREMDYLWKVTMGISQDRFDPKEILKMATVNAGKILNQKIGCIKENYLADCIFIDKKSLDLEPMNNVHASIVHRASEKSIKAVMIGGEIVSGKL